MTATNPPDRTPAPGIIPAPPHLNDNLAWPPATPRTPAEHNPGRRDPARGVFAKVMSALRGDKYMIDAYRAPDPKDAAPSDDPGSPVR
jgi:hypothetical protein